MADRSEKKDEYGAADLAAAAETTNNDEPLDVDGEEKDYIEVTSHGQPSSHSGSENGHNEKENRPGLEHIKSYATTTSVITRTESQADEPTKRKPWYKKYNPLRWGKIPPVPETRKVSREYNAPFLSLVYFQWMAPLMSVSLQLPQPQNNVLSHAFRLVTNDSSNRMTSGQSIPIDRPSL